jgi:hypothetical protein
VVSGTRVFGVKPFYKPSRYIVSGQIARMCMHCSSTHIFDLQDK